VASNLIACRQSRVTFDLLCAKITRVSLHQKLLQKHLVLQRNGVVVRSGDGCVHGWIADVRSNKWAMNLEKLQEFMNQTMLPAEAAKYCQNVCDKEMPRGLKKYLELELFPRIHMKVGKGISLSTARRWLQREGFKYTLHKKAIYYDGHDRADVVKDCQERFLPTMEEYRQQLVEYKMEDTTEEILKPLPSGV